MRRTALVIGALLLAGCPKSGGGESKPDVQAAKPDASAPAKSPPRARIPNTLLGGERGIDHVGVAVKDLAAAQKTYHEKLGFSRPTRGRLPNGLDNVNYYFEDATYLETLTYYDDKKAKWLAYFLGKFGEGGNFLVLSVRSIDATARFLEARGVSMSKPHLGSIRVKGKRGGSWRTLFFKKSPLPGAPVYFIGYPRKRRARFLRKLQSPRVRQRYFAHENGALGIKAVWMAVNDLEAAAKGYEKIGLARGRAIEHAKLGARGIELAAGIGKILLLAPAKKGKGAVAKFLARRPPGVLGMSILVKDLEAARALINKRNKTKLKVYDGPLGKSVLVPAKLAHHTYLELFSR
ncbi:MAG: VOC family protein [Myxococcales bacterium]|nr:VOC family protein [Myxococcales bacterium]